jgi:hypothetical protein
LHLHGALNVERQLPLFAVGGEELEGREILKEVTFSNS